ncbi:hypothetical protein MRB53_038755 [Persea americana]|nr:hypothetical protein MRB53_038755 [Persea americana]
MTPRYGLGSRPQCRYRRLSRQLVVSISEFIRRSIIAVLYTLLPGSCRGPVGLISRCGLLFSPIPAIAPCCCSGVTGLSNASDSSISALSLVGRRTGAPGNSSEGKLAITELAFPEVSFSRKSGLGLGMLGERSLGEAPDDAGTLESCIVQAGSYIADNGEGGLEERCIVEIEKGSSGDGALSSSNDGFDTENSGTGEARWTSVMVTRLGLGKLGILKLEDTPDKGRLIPPLLTVR